MRIVLVGWIKIPNPFNLTYLVIPELWVSMSVFQQRPCGDLKIPSCELYIPGELRIQEAELLLLAGGTELMTPNLGRRQR